jgi:hypothetical protein
MPQLQTQNFGGNQEGSSRSGKGKQALPELWLSDPLEDLAMKHTKQSAGQLGNGESGNERSQAIHQLHSRSEIRS